MNNLRDLHYEKVIAQGPRVYLRDRIPEDADTYIKWLNEGEWLAYDAPWEEMNLPTTLEGIGDFKHKFIENCKKELPTPRKSAFIITKKGKPIGWMNRYGSDHFADICFIGIDICEDHYLNLGYGTEALQLWVNYLFEHGKFHRIGIETWSFNPRMSRVAEKLGFIKEGSQREMVEWEGKRHDKELYSLLRREWEELSLAMDLN